MRLLRSVFLTGIPILLFGCQTPGADPYSSASASKAGAGGASPAPPRPQAYAISPSADVDDMVGAALSHHPSLQATRARIIALEQSAIQARALPDPMASAATGRMAETAAGRVVGTVGLQQKIPFPGKRSTAAVMILKKADAMRSQLKVTELALAERVRTAYWNYYAARQTVLVIAESRASLVSLREAVNARIAVAKASRQDVLRLQNEITRLDQRLAAARGREQASRATLNALMYRPSNSSLPGPRNGPLRQFGSTSSLLSRAQSRHPEVVMGQSRIAAAQHGVRLARLKRRPDFTAGLSYSPVADDGLAPSATGKDHFMGMLGITLPIWEGKNQAAEKEAAANLSAEKSSLASTRSSLQQRVESASAGYHAELATLSLYSGKLIPDAQQTFDLILAGYRAETATFLDVIDAWRQLLNYRLQYEENRSRAGKADAAVRFSAGLP